MTNSITIAWNNSTENRTLPTHMKGAVRWVWASTDSNRTVADDPTMIEKNTGRFVEAITSNYHSRTNYSSSQHSGLPVDSKHGLSQRISPVLWVKEKEQLNLECRTTPSKPTGTTVNPHGLDATIYNLSSHSCFGRNFLSKTTGFQTPAVNHERTVVYGEKQMVSSGGTYRPLDDVVGSEKLSDSTM
ncbi:hypothetical protein FGIG_04402 [Fasciola gigantica]|uniref:Uncharacterized protein n=1 Tax=Fasciola gigantica TaxID=46835 RepID=A0A504YYA8_FASGI|nr:hypothetical protein FGIG_04402 [Fasciola gigantica]